MGSYDFDRVIDRRTTESVKWDSSVLQSLVGRSDVIPMWVADMDFLSPPQVISALTDRVAHGIFGYPSAQAVEKSITAFSQWAAQRHGWEIPDRQIICSPGMITTLSLLITLTTEPGEGIIVQSPTYRPFGSIITAHGRKLVENRMLYDRESGTYTLDLIELEAQLARDENRLMIFCSPHNPAGRVWTVDELARVQQLCDRHDVLIISDEIHADLTYPAVTHTPFASLAHEGARAPVTCMAPSKTFNIAGEHISFTVIPDPELRAAYRDLLKKLSIATPGVLAMTAAEAAYQHGGPWLDELLVYLQRNLDIIEGFLKERLPMLQLVRPQASFIAFIDCTALLRKLPEASSLGEFFGDQAQVALHDGLWFGSSAEGFVRMNFAMPACVIEQSLEQIAAAVEQLLQVTP
ncbi:MAG: pyridoxal phosphate-dependent aminotransferase [Spirochaetia bacterium]|nr:pyridoxal phosphate-dependent aminotransferase [Spirochaetia bacterium]